MQLAGLVEGSRREYLQAVRQVAAYYMISPDHLSERNVEDDILYVRDESGAAKGTLAPIFAGLTCRTRFLGEYPRSGVPKPRRPSKLKRRLRHPAPRLPAKEGATSQTLRASGAISHLHRRPAPFNRSHQAHRDRSQRAAPPIPRRSASSKRHFASASRCE
jgi:hypothetical protein